MTMEFKMEITDGKGRNFNSNSMSDALVSGFREAIDSTLADAERAARRQICQVHQQRPSVKRRRVRDGYELQFEACCDDAVARAEAAASRVLG